MELGADPEELESLAGELDALADAITGALRRTAAGVRGAHWRGPDAEAFARQWEAQSRMLAGTGSDLRRSGTALRRNAEQQRRASAGDGAAALPRVGDPLPLRRETWRVSTAAGGLMVGDLAAAVRIDDLPGPTSMVSITTAAGLGASAGAGTQLGFSGGSSEDAVGAAVTAAAGTGLASTVAWHVADREASSFAGDRIRDLVVGSSPLGSAVGGIRHLLGADPPEPDTVTSTMGHHLSLGGSGGGSSKLSVSGRAGESWEIGIRERPEQTTVVLGASGAAAARLPGLLGLAGSQPSAAGSVELEVFPAAGGTRSVVLTTSGGTGSSVELTRTQITYDESTAGGALADALGSLTRGDTSGIERLPGELAGSILAVDVAAAQGSSSGGGGSASAQVGAGIDLSGSLEWSHTEVDLRH